MHIPRISREEAAVLVAAGVICSPLIITGGLAYCAGSAVQFKVRDAKDQRQRSARRLLRARSRIQTEHAGAAADLQAKERAVRDCPQDARARVQYALACFALGDMRAALAELDEALALLGSVAAGDRAAAELYVTASYFAGLCCMLMRRFHRGSALMEATAAAIERERAAGDAAFPTNGLRLCQPLAAAAYLRLLALLYGNKCLDKPLDEAGPAEGGEGREREHETVELTKARVLIDRALQAAEAAREDSAKTRATAAWVYFRLGLRTEGSTNVAVDVDLLRIALEHVRRGLIIVIEAMRRDGQGIAPDTSCKDLVNLAVRARHKLAADASAAAAPTPTVTPNAADNEDGDDAAADRAAETQLLTEAAASADGVSSKDLVSLMAQILLAFGDDSMQPDVDAALNYPAICGHGHADDPWCFSGPSCDLEKTGGDRRLGLLRPWPLAGADFATDTELRDHDFAEVRLWKPTWCDHCTSFIKERRALRCKGCKFEVHLEGPCHAGAQSQSCLRPVDVREAHKMQLQSGGDSQSLKHVHRYSPVRSATMRKCALCNGFIKPLTKPFQCTVCNTFAHKDCATSCANAVIDSK